MRIRLGELRQLLRESGRFSFNEFRALASDADNQEAVLQYLRSTLRFVASGSTRATFVLSSGKALKYAFESAGVGQNRAEIALYSSLKNRNIVPRLFSHDTSPRPTWLVVELVRPLNDESEFERLVGMSLSDVCNAALSDQPGPPVVAGVRELVHDHGVVLRDLRGIHQWGLTSSGNVVVLDAGFTAQVARDYY